jgi:hypothetical protein
LRRTLSELERELGGGKFCRIHRSVIVNLDRVSGLELQDDGEYEVVLKSRVRLRLSRRFRKNLQERLGVGRRNGGARRQEWLGESLSWLVIENAGGSFDCEPLCQDC